MKKRLAAFFLAILLSVSAFTFSCDVFADDTYPTMFVNDTYWANENIFPMQVMNGTVYVPATMLSALSGFKVSINTSSEYVLITKGDKYISINTKTLDSAYTGDDGLVSMRTFYILNNRAKMLYVPLETFSNYFGFQYEIYGKNAAVRISDRAGMSFTELLKIYNSQLLPGSTDPDVPKPYSQKKIYINVRVADRKSAVQTLNDFSKNGILATFYFSVDAVSDMADVIRAVASAGCGVALYAEPSQNSAATTYAPRFDAANETVCKIVKTKCRAIRLYDAATSDAIVSGDIVSSLGSEGYFTVAPTLKISEIDPTSEYSVGDFASKINSSSTIYIDCDSTDAGTSEAEFLIKYLKTNSRVIKTLVLVTSDKKS